MLRPEPTQYSHFLDHSTPAARRVGKQIIPAAKRGAIAAAYSPYLDRSTLRGQRAIEQMADDFRIFAVNAGSVSKDDLELLGWTPAQIASHGAAARQAANQAAANRRAQG